MVVFHNDNSTSSKTLRKKLIEKNIEFSEVVNPVNNRSTFVKRTVLEINGEQLGLVDSLNWVNDYNGGNT